MSESEVWKDITGYESRYEVSDLGRVRSLDRYSKHNTSKTGFILQKGQMLKPYMSKKGYLKVDLGDGFGKRKSVYVHRLVAIAFIDNPMNYNQVNHIDGVKTNNRLDNLEWCNNSMNQLHAYANGLNKPSPLAGKPKRPVYQIDKKTNEIVARFDSVTEAGVALGMKKPSNIITVCNGNRPYAGGYKWQYASSKKEVMPNDVK